MKTEEEGQGLRGGGRVVRLSLPKRYVEGFGAGLEANEATGDQSLEARKLVSIIRDTPSMRLGSFPDPPCQEPGVAHLVALQALVH